MRRTLFASLMILIVANSVSSQKRTTILGDAWVGVVVTTNEATREITLSSSDKTKTETFVGVLEEGYKQRLKDGSRRELKVSELEPGVCVRVFYKSKTRDVAGQKVKVHIVNRIDFLGRDEYTRMREALELPPSMPVVLAESDKLPATDPLRIYLSIEQPHVRNRFVKWVGQWNKEQGEKHGRLEIVPDRAQSDMSLVVFWGADESTVLIPIMMYDQSGNEWDIFKATAHLVTKDDQALRVLWLRRLLFLLKR